MESTLIVICGIVALYSAAMALLCALVQRRLRWLRGLKSNGTEMYAKL